MFKCNKLENITNENVIINKDKIIVINNLEGKLQESLFETLVFIIDGVLNNNNLSLTFSLNCEINELLKIEGTKDFKDYINMGETYFTINDENGIEPEKFDIKITRFIKNKYVIYANFIVNGEYFGILEFEFNLDDYLNE